MFEKIKQEYATGAGCSLQALKYVLSALLQKLLPTPDLDKIYHTFLFCPCVACVIEWTGYTMSDLLEPSLSLETILCVNLPTAPSTRKTKFPIPPAEKLPLGLPEGPFFNLR